ncbi:MAG: M48 family metallopeptidase [Candidatus Kapabacteria bacterium]|nr:M48 family metallopeptidase [Candidatus Kapabacteria bacterium]
MLLDPEKITYRLVRSQRRTVMIRVEPTAQIVVKAPWSMSTSVIDRYVVSQRDWIVRKVEEANARLSLIPQKTSPRQVYLRGNLLSWGWHDADIILPSGISAQAAPQWLARWQRAAAKDHFSSVINEYLPLLGVPALRYSGFALRKMRRSWGLCATNGVITLNEHLIRTPDICIRGIIVHELCHLVHFNHGPEFHSMVADLLPDHRIADALIDAWTIIIDV